MKTNDIYVNKKRNEITLIEEDWNNIIEKRQMHLCLTRSAACVLKI